MVEVIIENAEKINEEKAPKKPYKKGQVINIKKVTALRWIKNDWANLTQEEKEFLGKKEEPLEYMVAQDILKQQKIITTYDSEEMFFYENGVYKQAGEARIKEIIQIILKDKSTLHKSNEILGHIKRETYKDRNIFEKTPLRLLCLKNGIFDLEKKELYAHSPEYFFLQQIPIEYNPKANCPKTEIFITEILGEEDIPTAWEFMGYCLYRDYNIQKSFAAIGDGRNGKSTFLNLVRAILGIRNISGRSLNDLTKNKFAQADLFGKLANIYADLPAKDLADTANFKMLTGGDLIQAEKKFQQPFTFQNYAKLMFSANRLAGTPEDTCAFFRRWIIINFPNNFDEENANKDLIHEITTEEELSGIFNKIIKALANLLKRGQFSNSKSIEETREKYIRLSDSVAAFVMDCIEIAPTEYIPKKKLYEKYAEYCRTNNYPLTAENKFHKKMVDSVKIEEYRPTIDKTRVFCWRGIRVAPVGDVGVVGGKLHLGSHSISLSPTNRTDARENKVIQEKIVGGEVQNTPYNPDNPDTSVELPNTLQIQGDSASGLDENARITAFFDELLKKKEFSFAHFTELEKKYSTGTDLAKLRRNGYITELPVGRFNVTPKFQELFE